MGRIFVDGKTAAANRGNKSSYDELSWGGDRRNGTASRCAIRQCGAAKRFRPLDRGARRREVVLS